MEEEALGIKSNAFMWWSKIGQSSIITRPKSTTNYSVISAISNSDTEALAISN